MHKIMMTKTKTFTWVKISPQVEILNTVFEHVAFAYIKVEKQQFFVLLTRSLNSSLTNTTTNFWFDELDIFLSSYRWRGISLKNSIKL